MKKKKIKLMEKLPLVLCVIAVIILVSAYVGYDYGTKEKEREMINNFDMIEINGSFYELDMEASFEEGCYVMPQYKKIEGNWLYVTNLCIEWVKPQQKLKSWWNFNYPNRTKIESERD